jgi:glycosyltransferase involved in cell wall biosynthesis
LLLPSAGVRVLQIHNRYTQPGGEDVAVDRDAAILRASGHEVIQHVVANPDDRGRAAVNLTLSPWNPFAKRALAKVIEEATPDVAHVHNTWFSLTAATISALSEAGIPIVMTLHNYRLMCINALLMRDDKPCTLCVGASPWSGVRYRCYRGSMAASAAAAAALAANRQSNIWSRVDRFVVMSEFVASMFERGGIFRERMDVRPNFAEDPGPRPNPPSASDTVLFVGRLSPEKGIEFLLDTWKSADTGALKIRVVGDGPLRSELERRHPEVEFTGFLDAGEVRGQMLAARALVFPSLWYEGANPLTVTEALASRLPVLSSDHGAMSEVLDGLDGWLRIPGDVSDWKAGLVMLNDDREVDRAGDAARILYEQRYTTKKALGALEGIYAGVAGQASVAEQSPQPGDTAPPMKPVDLRGL